MKHFKCSYKQFDKKVEELNMPEYKFRYYSKRRRVRVYRKEDAAPTFGNFFKAICEFNAYQFRKGNNEDIKKAVILSDKSQLFVDNY